MAFLWLLPCFTLFGASFGSGAHAREPELSIKPRIMNGEDARPGAWPWHVSLQTPRGRIFCGGSLINMFWVITSAHCNVTQQNFVVTGLFDRTTLSDRIQILRIVKVIPHPMYNVNSYFADIALLRLSTPAHLHETVSPIHLPTVDEQFFEGTLCTIMGWGYTHPNGSMIPFKLQQATVRLISMAKCKRSWGKYVSSSMICAAADNVHSCSGDSGSPLVCLKDGFWKLVGITCYATKECDSRMPTVYTRVTSFRPWIEDVLAHN